MKKRTLLILIFAALLLIAPACANKDDAVEAPPAAVEEDAAPAVEDAPAPALASGPCNNILFPLADGNQWVYEATSTGGGGSPTTSEYAWSVSAGSGDSVTLGTMFYDSGTVVSANVQCVDGAVENFPLTVSNIAIGDMEGAIEYTYVSGKYLPSLQELEAGNWQNTWQTVVNSSGTITTDYEGENMTIVLEESPITMDWQILEKDVSVSVPAGTFDNAVRINQQMVYEIKSMKISSGDMPLEISTTMTFDSDYWFVPNLGLVKTQVNSANMDLFGSNFPVEMTGGSVLKSSSLLN
jgi:hypothetical protein